MPLVGCSLRSHGPMETVQSKTSATLFESSMRGADREQPEYFPAKEPAEKTYDTGRLKW